MKLSFSENFVRNFEVRLNKMFSSQHLTPLKFPKAKFIEGLSNFWPFYQLELTF